MTSHYTDHGALLIRNSDIKDGRFEFGDNPIYLDDKFAKQNASRKHKVGDVITVHTGDIGTSAVITEKEAGSIGFATIVTRPDKEKITSEYLCAYLNTDTHKNFAMNISTGDGRNNYNLKDYYECVVPVPSVAEQKKISSFIEGLNNLITLHQRKCINNTIKHINDWEQRKVSEVAEIIGGGTPSTSNSEYWDGDINWYAPAEIGEQIYVESSERKITKLGLEKSSAKILPAHKTVLFTSRAGIGNTAILRAPAATNQGFQSMVLHDDINTYFVYSMTDMIKAKAERVASGSTFAEISGKMLGNLEFMFPSKPEQDKIGGYFESIDNLITLHQR